MNRYKWLAQYVLRMRNKGESVLVHKYAYGIKHYLPRLAIVNESSFLGDNYFINFTMYPKSNGFVPKVIYFQINKTTYELILRSFK